MLRCYEVTQIRVVAYLWIGVEDDVSGKLWWLRSESEDRRNYLKAHLWASTAVFHWSCFAALMKEHGQAATEDAKWKAGRVTKD